MGQVPMVNVTATANLYSQVAGVLAGLTFTGLLLYLTARPEAADQRKRKHVGASKDPREGARKDATASSLFAAFVALTICAFIYAALAGGKSESVEGPAPTGLILYGGVFGVAILAMFHAAFLLLITYGSDLVATIGIVRHSVYIFGPTIVMLFISLGTIYVYLAGSPSGLASIRLSVLGFVTPLIILIVSVISYRRHQSQSERELGKWSARSVRPARFVLIVSMVSPLFMIWLATRPTDYRPGEGTVTVIILGAFLFLGVFSVLTKASFYITDLPRGSGVRVPDLPPPAAPGSPVRPVVTRGSGVRAFPPVPPGWPPRS